MRFCVVYAVITVIRLSVRTQSP